MFNQPSVTCEAALLVALQNRRLVGSLLPQKKTVQFSRTSLSYRPIAALSTGVDRDPRSIRVFAQIRGEIFAFLGLWPSVIARSRVQILDLAPLYRTVGATLSTGCYVVLRRLSVRRDSIASSTGRRRPPGPLSISLLSPAPCSWRPPACLSRTPDTWAEKFESLERKNSIRESNRSFDSCNSRKRPGNHPVPAAAAPPRRPVLDGSPAVYMSYMSQNFCLFPVSKLSVLNFRIFLLMYPESSERHPGGCHE